MGGPSFESWIRGTGTGTRDQLARRDRNRATSGFRSGLQGIDGNWSRLGYYVEEHVASGVGRARVQKLHGRILSSGFSRSSRPSTFSRD